MPEEVVVPVVEPTQKPNEAPAVVEPAVEPELQPAGGVEPSPAETPEQVQERKHKSAQRRIDALTREKHDALREAEYWKTKAVGTQPAEVQPSGASGKPMPENFNTVEEYVDALTDWKLQTRDAKTAEEQERSERERVYNEAVTSFQPQLTKAREKYEDYDEVVNQPIFTPTLQTALLDSEQGAEIAYYLGTHPTEAERLNGLTPIRMLRELGKMEIRIAAQVQTKPVSTAPAPIVPVKGASPAQKDTSKMSAQEYYDAKAAGLV